MPRNIPLGNGNMLVAFDKDYRLREFFFPYVGEENHTNGNKFMMGVWIEEDFHWIDSSWIDSMKYIEDTLVTQVILKKEQLDLELLINDCVDFHENVYMKKITVTNLSQRERLIKIFFTQDFSILGNEIGDTAVYRPENKTLLHYKSNRYFLINIFGKEGPGIANFAIGSKGKNNLEGTFKDAEDGKLGGNPIEQGSVDSVVGSEITLSPVSSGSFYYYICAGKCWGDVNTLNSVVIEKTPQEIIRRTANYWKLWVSKEPLPLDKLPEMISSIYRKSLLILRTQLDNGGGILAANDSDVMQYNRDTYSYIWPRDGALVAHSLDLAGYGVLSSNFYKFCEGVICEDGFLFHKYTPSGNVGSSWHPWVIDGKKQLPIQEDETALVLWALWEHFKKYRDIEFIKPLYKRLIKNCAYFLCSYRDRVTKLPRESYDLWEERLGVHAFTVASVYGGMIAAANFAKAFGEIDVSEHYRNSAQDIKESFEKYMYIGEENRFARMSRFENGKLVYLDKTVDASLYSIFAFGMYSAKDEKVAGTMESIMKKLWCNTEVGGIARYEDDPYYRISNETTGNPWFITTLWMALYYIETGDQGKALELLQWVASRSLESGVLSEQVNPYTNAPLSVSPLTWSHATYVHAVLKYLEKFYNCNIFNELR
ncbi:glycoside hydrolase family 15 protein [uncultured Ilyobacter sp.]|uniref:glycoside hydrolase family 15 protein n=1 Tax=uncultured Ilyobacter sp. TaxID=544433 RepID=UPI0029F549E8|nr:glycoside hydrolase family 15 protein [uncultured Ilyobacter sp.]